MENARLEARMLLEHTLGETAIVFFDDTTRVGSANSQGVLDHLARRLAGKPLAYIVGHRHFWKHRFNVNEHTLIPRADSEILIEKALHAFPRPYDKLRVLDLGTGTGCLLLSFLNERPNARGLGVDISLGALTIAEQNAKNLELNNKTQFIQSDWFQRVRINYDVIFCNPPYIGLSEKEHMAPETLAHEPEHALFAANDGLAVYSLLAEKLHHHLKPQGKAFIELNALQHEAIRDIFAAANKYRLTTHKDLGGNWRLLIVSLQ